MAYSSTRRRDNRVDQWPGFVDALATLLLVFIFLTSLFMIAQFFLSREVSSRDTVLTRLNAQISELTELLALERSSRSDVEDTLAALQASLSIVTGDRERLQGLLDSQRAGATDATGAISGLRGELESERQLSREALSQVEILNQQIAALRSQIASLEQALGASEQRDEQSQAQIADLGRRLNVALAQRVQELSRYRSDFFGRLRDILADRTNIRIVGDRFVFSSEVLFPSGSDDLNSAGRGDLDEIAAALIELEGQIPPEIAWVLRVDGHTDARPVSGTGRFRSNWDLSAARAIAVVRYLIERGVDPVHLVAAGFGEFQPIDPGTGEEANARNRRIELKLTER